MYNNDSGEVNARAHARPSGARGQPGVWRFDGWRFDGWRFDGWRRAVAGGALSGLCALCGLCLLLAACQAPLRRNGDRFLLPHALADYDDSVFVWSDAGKAAPRIVDVQELADRLLPYDVVFFGEFHDHAGVHLAELRLLRALVARDPRWILSLEQFERDVQDVLDDYLAGNIGEVALQSRGRAWDNYASAYRPLLLFAASHHLPVIAAEAPQWAVDCVGAAGPDVLERFTPLERSTVAAELHVMPGAYRDKFMAFQQGSAAHGGGGTTPEALARADRSFAAQALRDDTMAESIAAALARYPDRKLLHVTGSFHVAGFLGTVERLRLRAPRLKIAVIEPVEAQDPRAPAVTADDLAAASADLIVYPDPEEFVEGEDMSAWIAKMAAKRKAHTCRYLPDVTSPTAGP